MNDNANRYMQRAIELAKLGKENEGGSFGAVIVRNGTVLAEGFNKVKALSDCTQHAELLVIQEACRKLNSTTLKDCTLYTSCEPCMMCLGAIYWAKFKKVYYGSSAQDAKEHGFIYSNMFYDSNTEARQKEFNLEQLMAEEAVKVWQ
ncbi:tRNA(Arg) A34 adenosine deaminase TadA [Maribacter sedimenticola]|uniref:tRNA(Arg) A34 adenosine deaminase TadA n=1 Tax=Maribacter sedimenticola TaxID=228956 RepID=A0ABY1SIW3_9FLAO|nr:nucleoside deaminase [Maribacter sedimenticola]SNR59769.1 tRNA(Arg) A34 adenosine deaminase TadA [Maribacter sedimenticola]